MRGASKSQQNSRIYSEGSLGFGAGCSLCPSLNPSHKHMAFSKAELFDSSGDECPLRFFSLVYQPARQEL